MKPFSTAEAPSGIPPVGIRLDPVPLWGIQNAMMRVISMTTNEFQVTGMHCGHCESAVREEVAKVAGVEQIDVSAASGRLLISASDPLDDAAVLAAVVEAGYEAARV